MGRTTINTPHDLRLLRELNKDKPYSQQIRPGTFLTLAHAHPIEGPGLLVAPYTSDPNEALQTDEWINRGTGQTGFRIRTKQPEYAIEGSVAVLDYRHYAEPYMSHHEWKAQNSGPGSRGELTYRPVLALDLVAIGKEAGVFQPEVPIESGVSQGVIQSVRICNACGRTLTGRQRRWCSEKCRRR